MKHFLADILITLAIGLGISVIIWKTVCPWVATNRTDNEFVDKKSYIENNANDISILLMGHSQSEYGLNPSVFDSAYNTALAARISSYDAALLEMYVPQMERLKAVVFPLICEYEPGTALLKADWRQKHMLAYEYIWGIEPPDELEERSLSLKDWHEKVSQMFTVRPIGRFTEYDSLGFFAGEGVGDGNNVHDAPGSEPLVKASLRRMAKVCQEHCVRLIVVTMPCNSTYRADHTDCDSRLQRLMDDIAADYPAVEYRCYLNDERFGDSLFSDQTHMNRRGATAFSLQLKEDFGL